MPPQGGQLKSDGEGLVCPIIPPNQSDRSFASRAGQKAGGAIKIHGLLKKYRKLGKLHRFYDWTAGCIAVTDEEVDYLYENTAVGTPIRILH